MRFHLFHNFSSRTVGKTTLVLATLLLAGCSSNTMRFADGMFKIDYQRIAMKRKGKD